MNAHDIQQAASLLIAARKTGTPIDALPPSCTPANLAEAHAIQDATVAALGETVMGWKVGAAIDGDIVRGALLSRCVHASPASVPAKSVPLLGVEAEIAFRFDRDLPPRAGGYTYGEVADAVTAFPAIEVVATRFRDYKGTPLIPRIADCVSNGAFIRGAPQPHWRAFDLKRIGVRLALDGVTLVEREGGHPSGDPLLPAVDLVNALARTHGVKAGQVMTTGTYTGLNFAKPGQTVHASFAGFGSVDLALPA